MHNQMFKLFLKSLDILAEVVETAFAPKKLLEKEKSKDKHGYEYVNKILDDIQDKMLALASVKISSINWTGRNELYDLGMLYKKQYRIEIQRM